MNKPTVNWIEENYSKQEVMIPMRDGTGLYTAIYCPFRKKGECAQSQEEAGAPPVLLLRTPFPLKPYGEGRMASNLRGSLAKYAEAGYIIVQQNVRGTYLSEGEFINVRPASIDEFSGMLISTSEMTDTYDTVEWVLKNLETNGKVGVKGVSYPGFYASCAAICGHPAIKAVSPQAPVTDWFMGDDIHHNGALMLSDTYHFGRFFFRKRPHPSSRILPTITEQRKDVYRFFLKKGAISDILGPLAARRSFFKDIVSHPDYDAFWQERDASTALGQAYAESGSGLPALMIVGGTFDAEDCYGPLKCWEQVKNSDRSCLVLGPWAHGSWNKDEFDHLADSAMSLGNKTLSEYYLESIEYPFFAHYLEGPGESEEIMPFEKVRVFPSVAESYENRPKRSRWKNPVTETLQLTSDNWPLTSTHPVKIYLNEGKKLGLKPVGASSEDFTGTTYISDPKKPVPVSSSTSWIRKDYMAADQRFASRRKDVLTFRGTRQKATMVIAGPVKVSLSIVIDSSDVDMVVKLIDVRPDGYQMLIRGDIMPMRYRNSFSKPTAVRPGKPTRLEFTMNDVAHVLKPGHKLMVQVQSSWYPLFAMNPQKFMSNPYKATVNDYRTAHVTVIPGDSWIELEVL